MLVPNRYGSSDTYRYGFNGKEKDDELKGDGNSYDYRARMLDSRIGRWFAPDKMERKHSMLSPYVGMANNPIFYIDADGNENIIYIVNVPDSKGKKTISDVEIQKRIDKANNILSSKAEKGGYELNTRYVLFNPDGNKTRGVFSRKFIDKTDSVILMGNSEDIKRYDRNNNVTISDELLEKNSNPVKHNLSETERKHIYIEIGNSQKKIQKEMDKIYPDVNNVNSEKYSKKFIELTNKYVEKINKKYNINFDIQEDIRLEGFKKKWD